MPDLVVGVDAGATTTRCLVVATDATIAGAGSAAGANIRSSAGSPAERFGHALSAALAAVDPADVRAGVFGVAGAGSAGARVVGEAAATAWRAAGLAGQPRVVTDLEVAFAAGSPHPDGLLLLAGTGAAAVRIAERRIARRCDGYGWLLGDEGSAVWLGLRGARAALDAYDGRGPATRLRTDIAAYFGSDPDWDLAQTMIARVHADAPARLGELARLVTRAADEGDDVASALVEAAADRLIAAIDAVAPEPAAGAQTDLVLAGALLASGPVRAAVLARLTPRAGLLLLDAGPGAAGAAALALSDLAQGKLDPARHANVLRAAGEAAHAGHVR